MPGNKGMMYLKKNCFGCAAMQGKCLLGHPVSMPGESTCYPEPCQLCPKPRTKKHLAKLLAAKTSSIRPKDVL